MKNWLSSFAFVALLAATTVPALANLPNPNRNPRPRPNSNVRMSIEPNQEAKDARLVIPRAVWRNMVAELDGQDTQTTAALSGSTFTPGGMQTVMAGLCLSLAFAFGGVWFVRARKPVSRPARVALGVLALALCSATVAGLAYANAGPPPVARSLTSKILIPDAQWYGVYGQVKVEVVEDGEQIRLILPKPKENNKD